MDDTRYTGDEITDPLLFAAVVYVNIVCVYVSLNSSL